MVAVSTPPVDGILSCRCPSIWVIESHWNGGARIGIWYLWYLCWQHQLAVETGHEGNDNE